MKRETEETTKQSPATLAAVRPGISSGEEGKQAQASTRKQTRGGAEGGTITQTIYCM